MNIKIGHVRTPGIVGVVNANADALIKVIKIGGNFMAYQKSLNRLVAIELVCLLGMSIANHKLITICDENSNAKCKLLAEEIDKLRAEKNGAAEETEM